MDETIYLVVRGLKSCPDEDEPQGWCPTEADAEAWCLANPPQSDRHTLYVVAVERLTPQPR